MEDGHGGQADATSALLLSRALPTDSLYSLQWAMEAMNVVDVWDDYTGAGVSVVIHDDGIDESNPDLSSNIGEYPFAGVAESHGTFVAGLVGAARNGEGTVGVAYGATLIDAQTPGVFGDYGDFREFDIVNNSWYSPTSNIFRGWNVPAYAEIEEQAEQGRDGLGTITVSSAGNERKLGADANEVSEWTSRHVIVVGSIETDGKVSDFSNPGASILVVAPGRDVVSTDKVGEEGFGGSDQAIGPDYSWASGTSVSSPLVAGVIALMLEANPNLGWRDVQEILAYSAWNSDPGSASWTTNGASNWNGGGLHVSRDYGFGLVDARAAVRLAETWQMTSTSENEVSATQSTAVGQAIPDNSGIGLSSTVHVSDDIEIDNVQVTVSITHSNIGDLILELVSPDGTRSVLLDRIQATSRSATDHGSTADNIEWTFKTTHDWGESSVGDWTLVVRDAVTGEVGTLNSWSLQIFGSEASPDDTYIYTVDFGDLTGSANASRRTLSDSEGYDIINASAIYQDAVLNLGQGAISQLAGNSLQIAAGTVIEAAYLGDGDDVVTGNGVDNLLHGGRGNDVLEGLAGSDTLDGAQGIDTASYEHSAAGVSIDLAAATASGGDAGGDVLMHIENLRGSSFADLLAGDTNDNTIQGGAGDDALSGVGGDDVLQGGTGNDLLAGGDGDDALNGGAGSNTIDGGAGRDTVYVDGLSSSYTVSTVSGITTVTGAQSIDTISNVEFLQFYDQRIYIGGANNAPTAVSRSFVLTERGVISLNEQFLLAGASDADSDSLSLGYLYGAAHGTVTLTSDNQVRFVVDPDFVGTTSFDFTVSDGRGGEGTATITVTVNPTFNYVGSAGADLFLGLGSADIVFGAGGNDSLDGGYGNDVLRGGLGNDDLTGGAGSDHLEGGAGLDTARYDQSSAAVVVDLLAGTAAGGDAAGDVLVDIENLVGSGNNDVLVGNRGANTLSGLAGNDILDGGVGADLLYGDDGDDVLIGGSGNDTLYGGSGSDVLRGGAGADTLVGGPDTDVASYADAGGAVTINLTTGVKLGADAANDIFISIDGLEGSNFDDELVGNATANILFGGKGDDLLQGLAGSDTYGIEKGDGDDVIVESADATGTDRLIFGLGLNARDMFINRSVDDVNDVTLEFATGDSVFIGEQFQGTSGYGIERFAFANGATWTAADLRAAYLDQVETDAADSVLAFNNANDVIQGGGGDDTLRGLSGSDTYIYEAADGNDTILEGAAAADIDRILLGTGLLASNVLVERSVIDTDDVTLVFTGGSIFLDEQFFQSGSGYGVETITFGDGTLWDNADLKAAYLAQHQTSGDDLVWGFNNEADLLQGGSGNDDLYGLGGNDTYTYSAGDGNDRVYETAGGDTDQLVLGATLLAQDVIAVRGSVDQDDVTLSFAGSSGSIFLDEQLAGGGNGVEQIVFGDGRTWSNARLLQEIEGRIATAGNDVLHGAGNASDTLQGLAGDDNLYGYSGSDIYLYGVGDGNDTVNEAANTSDVDRIVFGTGIAAADVAVVRSAIDGNDVTLLVGTSGSIILDNQFVSGIEEIEFADGTVWDAEDIKDASIHYASTPGNDSIRGFELRADQISGGAGDDVLYGYTGSDSYLIGINEGADVIYEDTNASDVDVVVFGAGLSADDLIIHRGGFEDTDMELSFNGSTGTIVLSGQFRNGAGIERVTFDDGTTLNRDGLLKVFAGVDATSGNDTLVGSGYLWGKEGDDTLTGTGYTNFYYDYGDGHDVIDGYGTLTLGAGISPDGVVITRDPNDVYSAVLTFNDGGTLTLKNYLNNYGPDQIYFADGTNWDRAEGNQQVILQGTPGDDNLQGTSNGETLQGGAGDDYISGGAGSDIYIYAAGDGDDTIYENSWGGPSDVDTLRLVGLNSADIVVGFSYSDVNIQIISTGETITLYNQASGNYGVENVVFADGTVWHRDDLLAEAIILGGAGDDSLYGSDNNDRLRGALGDDYLSGSRGNDTYEYASGDGNDSIDETEYEGGEADTLRLLDLDASDVTLSFDQTDLVVTINATGETIYVYGQFAGQLGQGQLSDGIESIAFSGGTVWDRSQIETEAGFVPPLFEVVGTEAADVLTGDSGNNTILGLGGDDTIFGGDGNDVVRGGAGDDTIDGGDGFDTADYSDVAVAITANLLTGVVSGVQSGNDALLNIEAVVGSQAGDVLTGNTGDNELHGGDGDDVLSGGAGDDYLEGGNGSDIYLFNLGDGVDFIWEDGSIADTDQIWFGSDIEVSDVEFTIDFRGDFSTPALIIGTGGDEIFLPELFDNPARFIEEIHFHDGTVWTINQLAQQYLESQITSGDDYISGTGLNDSIDAGNGWDYVYGGAGNDTISGGADDDYLYGEDGDDLLNGGTGNDRLYGNAGSDTYVYASGGGNDRISDQSNGDTAGVDSLILSDLNVADLTFTKQGSTLVIAITGTGEEVRINSQFGSDFGPDGIEEIHFQDGTVWDISDISQAVGIDPNAEYLNGTDGDDVFNGGLGDDTIDSGAGNDRFIYAAGDGDDVINEWSSSTTESDTLQLTGLTSDDVTFAHVDNDLVITVVATGETITVQSQFQNSSLGYGIDRVEFAGGEVWNRAAILANSPPPAQVGTPGDDSLSGSNLDDTFTGGLGNDSLYGGGGNDTYLYSAGDGSDFIYDNGFVAADSDTLKLVDLLAADVTLTHAGNDLLLQINATGETITVGDQFYADFQRYGIERIVFADGTAWGLSNVYENAWYRGTAGGDTISGSAVHDVIFGDAGDDVMSGGGDADVFIIKPGFGHDTVTDFSATGGDTIRFSTEVFADYSAVLDAAAQVGSDVVITFDVDNSLTLQNVELTALGLANFQFSSFGASSAPLSLVGDNLANVLTGADGADTLTGNGGDDLLTGGFGSDMLDGGSDNDTLNGGFGNDTMAGGTGADTYIFSRGHGQDLIVEVGSPGDSDILRLGSGILASDIHVGHGSEDVWDLVLDLGQGDLITVDDQFTDNSRIDEIHFADGTVWTEAMLRATYLAQHATAADDVIDGFIGADIIDGGAGDDVIRGYDGADILAGGAGNDDLYGMEGADTYLFKTGDGNDWIHESSTVAAIDKVVFATGIGPDDVTIGRGPGSLDLSLSFSSGDELTVIGQFDGTEDRAVEQFEFANGTIWSAQDVREMYLSQSRTIGSDQIDGFFSDDVIDGGAGHDTLRGLGGDDVLIGGEGDDDLVGGLGSDTFVFATGFGNDTISDFDAAGGDVIEFDGAFDNFDDVLAAASEVNGDTVIAAAGHGTIVLEGVQLATLQQDDFRFAA